MPAEKTTEALQKENQRLRDLVRYCRHDLHREELITDQEFADLLTSTPGSVARLEGYDGMRAENKRLKESLAHAERSFELLQKEKVSEVNKRMVEQLATERQMRTAAQEANTRARTELEEVRKERDALARELVERRDNRP